MQWYKTRSQLQKNPEKPPTNTWRLKNMSLSSKWVNNEIKGKNQKISSDKLK